MEETLVSSWNNPAPKNSFESQVQEHIEKFQPVYNAWRVEEETWSFNEGLDIRIEGFYHLLTGYLTRIFTFDGKHLEAYERAKEYTEEEQVKSIITKWHYAWDEANPNFVPVEEEL